MKTRILISAIVAGSTLLAGCATPLDVKVATSDMGDSGILYGIVNDVKPAVDVGWPEACDLLKKNGRSFYKYMDQAAYDFNQSQCQNVAHINAVGVNVYGKWGRFVKIAVLTPKSEQVAVGDVIRFYQSVGTQRWTEYKGLAAKAAEREEKKCDWVGSPTWNLGGVVCEGYSYTNLPGFKN